jgi:hypothetical protein
MVRSQPGQIIHKTLSRKIHHKNRAGEVAQGEGLSSSPRNAKKKKKESVAFLYICNEKSKNKINKRLSFAKASTNTNYLVINSKEVQGLYTDNYKTLLKEIK